MLFQRVALIGVGMIGGSFVSALKSAKLVSHVVGVDIDKTALNSALKLGVIDSTASIETLDNIDAIILATPVGAMFSIFTALQQHGLIDVLITDVGSTKQSVIDAAEKALGYIPKKLVPGHPVAGKEYIGVEHASADLFAKHKAIITPADNTDADALSAVTAMWKACGATVNIMSAKEHDRILAATSHLPHILAYVLVDSLVSTKDEDCVFTYAAGGFKSFTRTASSNPIMWRDVCLANQEAILMWLEHYQNKLNTMKELIENKNLDAIEAVFMHAKQNRDEHFEKTK